jgi:hypothetical protein
LFVFKGFTSFSFRGFSKSPFLDPKWRDALRSALISTRHPGAFLDVSEVYPEFLQMSI